MDKVFIFGKVKVGLVQSSIFALYFGGLLVKLQEISVDFKAREVGRLILTCAYTCVTQRTTTNRVRFERVRNNSHPLEQLEQQSRFNQNFLEKNKKRCLKSAKLLPYRRHFGCCFSWYLSGYLQDLSLSL